MNLLVIGSGGREHAICYKLRQSNRVNELFCLPGNAGTKKIAKNINQDISNFEEIYKIIKQNKVDIVIIGPEEPLVNGITDFLKEKSVRVLGPSKFAAQLEGSKAFMKNLCKKNNIPTADFGVFDKFDVASNFIEKSKIPIVVKADGLAAGKGVLICNSKEEAIIETKKILNGKFKSSKKVVLEEFLEGEELSYFVLVDKNSYSFFGSAQDHKKVGEGDTGLNTGGMGAYSPARNLTEDLEFKIKNKIIEPTLQAMKALGYPYTGFLYAGLMIKNGEPYLIEYNIRMGDPECQVILPRLKTDLVQIIKKSVVNKLKEIKIEWKKEKSMTIVLCSKGYPGKYKKNILISNLKNLKENKKDIVYHAGTKIINGKLLSVGGRVLNFTSSGNNLFKVREKIIKMIKKLKWKSGFFRKDIGWKVLDKK